MYDGLQTRFDGAFYPKIDEIYEFETDLYPFGNFMWSYDIILRVDNGKCYPYEKIDDY